MGVSTTVKAQTLAWIEDATARGQGMWVRDLVTEIDASETTIRKAVNELLGEGFIRRVPLATTQFEAVRKNGADEEEGGEHDMTDTETTPRRGRKPDPEVRARDERALEEIASAGGLSAAALAQALDVKQSLAYGSIYRLRVAGRVAKTRPEGAGRQPVWVPA